MKQYFLKLLKMSSYILSGLVGSSKTKFLKILLFFIFFRQAVFIKIIYRLHLDIASLFLMDTFLIPLILIQFIRIRIKKHKLKVKIPSKTNTTEVEK